MRTAWKSLQRAAYHRGDRIAAIGPDIEASNAKVVDAADMIVLPGLINGHLHTWQTGLRGLAVPFRRRDTSWRGMGTSLPAP
jgi:cytosine/adenosine deaminase-related metal-dependent hydrolase